MEEYKYLSSLLLSSHVLRKRGRKMNGKLWLGLVQFQFSIMTNILNSRAWKSCLTSLTVSEEEFLFTLVVLAVFQLMVLLLSLTTVRLAFKTKTRMLESKECAFFFTVGYTYDKVGVLWWWCYTATTFLEFTTTVNNTISLFSCRCQNFRQIVIFSWSWKFCYDFLNRMRNISRIQLLPWYFLSFHDILL